MKHQPKWLDRSLVGGPFYTLVLNEEAYLAAYAHVGAKYPDKVDWKRDGAACSFLRNEQDKLCVIVSYGGSHEPVEVAGLLVHEAVHVFQEHCRDIGERAPSAEFEAYSIQWISQQLMWSYVEQTQPKKRKG